MKPIQAFKKVEAHFVIGLFVVAFMITVNFLPYRSCGYPASANVLAPSFLIEVVAEPGQPHVRVYKENTSIETRLQYNATTHSFVNGTGVAAFHLDIWRTDTSTADATAVVWWRGGDWSVATFAKPNGQERENQTSVLVRGGSSSSLNLSVAFGINHPAQLAAEWGPTRFFIGSGFGVGCGAWSMVTELNIE